MNRLKAFFIAISCGFSFLIVGLFYLQVIRGSYYRHRSEDNRIMVVPIDGPRGRIFDRTGKPIVDNRISFDLYVIYKEAGDFRRLEAFLKTIFVNIDKKKLLKVFQQAKWQPFTPTLIMEDIGKEKAIVLEQSRLEYPGLRINTRPRREYIYGRAASSVTGYLGRITEKELDRLEVYGFTKDDYIGRSGIEKKYDDYLRGQDGGLQIEVDSRGRQQRTLSVEKAEPGNPLYLTIDIELQKFCEEELGDKKGCVVVMNPETGEIYALVSKPDFDPNIFVTKGKGNEIKAALHDKRYPLLNRCISCTYPPGSVFKVVTSAAALESGKISVNTSYQCSGAYKLGEFTFKCWKAGGHGTQNVLEAIKHSCDVFFYNTGLKVGAEVIADYALKFGYGKQTGIDLPGEMSGLVPNARWKFNLKKESWYKGDTLNYSIGQGYLLTTPIQVVRMVACIANGGYLVKPYILEKVGNIEFAKHDVKKIGLHQDTIDMIKTGLSKVVNEEGGTGVRAKLPGVLVAGKTGTAQTHTDKNHGWFTGFAPLESPKVCFVVFVEFGGSGGGEASIIAGHILSKIKERGLL